MKRALKISFVFFLQSVGFLMAPSVYAGKDINFQLDITPETREFIEARLKQYQLPTKLVTNKSTEYHVTIGHLSCVPDDRVESVVQAVKEKMAKKLSSPEFEDGISFTPEKAEIIGIKASNLVLIPNSSGVEKLKKINLDLFNSLEEYNKSNNPEGDQSKTLSLNKTTLPRTKVLPGAHNGFLAHLSLATMNSSQFGFLSKRLDNVDRQIKIVNSRQLVGKEKNIIHLKKEVTVLVHDMPGCEKPVQKVICPPVGQAVLPKAGEMLGDLSKVSAALPSETKSSEVNEPNSCVGDEVVRAEREGDKIYQDKLKVLLHMSPSLGVQLVGSAGSPSVHPFPADIDGFEKIHFTADKPEVAAQYFASSMQSMVRKLVESTDPKIYFGEIKAGLDHRYDDVSSSINCKEPEKNDQKKSKNN